MDKEIYGQCLQCKRAFEACTCMHKNSNRDDEIIKRIEILSRILEEKIKENKMDIPTEGIYSVISFPIGQYDVVVSLAIERLLNEGWNFDKVENSKIHIKRKWIYDPNLNRDASCESGNAQETPGCLAE